MSTRPAPPPLAESASASAPAAEAPAPDYSLRRYVVEGVEVFTNADSRLARSFRALLGRPGELTRAYFSPERESYLRPLQLFLLCNVLYFFVQPLVGWNTLTSPLRVHLWQLPYSPLVRPMVGWEIGERGVSEASHTALFDATITANAKTLVIVMVPMFALVLALLFARGRRYFVEHMVFATHLVAFFILTLPAALVILALLGRGLVSAGAPAGPVGFFFDALTLPLYVGAYAYFALRRAYGTSRAAGVLRAVGVGAAMMLVIQTYRAVLFFATFWTV